MTEIFNCPYCGSVPKVQYKLSSRPIFWVECEDCGLSGPIKEDDPSTDIEYAAIISWNWIARLVKKGKENNNDH